jgi:hypothetical protein
VTTALDSLATTRGELAWIAERARECRYVIEIGVWLGRSLKAWADNLPTGGLAVGVDAWSAEHYGSPSMQANLLRVGPDEAYARCRAALAEHLESGRVRLLRSPAVEAAALVDPGADLVYLDAATEYAETAAQLAAYEPLVRPGGTICGHHYQRRAGTRTAVDARYGDRVKSRGQLWWVAL